MNTYVINLERRLDRLEDFTNAVPNVCKPVQVFTA